jgi:uncharacterized protein (TIGR02466 family)
MTRALFATQLSKSRSRRSGAAGSLAHAIAGLRRTIKQAAAGRNIGMHDTPAMRERLPRRDPDFADLAKLLTRHAAKRDECAFDLGRKPKLDSLWVNLLKSGGHHSGHIHPHSIISGTLYVEVPKGSGSLRFEDPRLPLMMSAPPRRPDAPRELQSFVTVEPRAGLLLMWESWLRHEVLPGSGSADRLSISFNFA